MVGCFSSAAPSGSILDSCSSLSASDWGLPAQSFLHSLGVRAFLIFPCLKPFHTSFLLIKKSKFLLSLISYLTTVHPPPLFWEPLLPRCHSMWLRRKWAVSPTRATGVLGLGNEHTPPPFLGIGSGMGMGPKSGQPESTPD